MSNSYFQFKNFIVNQDRTAMKVCTDSCILGAYISIIVKDRILDIGTGTGLLALMLAQRYQVPVDAVEINEDAALQAEDNVRESLWHNRITVFHEDIKNFQNLCTHRYDLIVCNPPFYTNHLTTTDLARDQAMHNLYLPPEVLIQSVRKLLSPQGSFYVLLPQKQGEHLEKLVTSHELFIDEKLTIRDKPGSNILRVILKIQSIPTEITESQLTIKTSFGDYSRSFQQLLHPYYLRL